MGMHECASQKFDYPDILYVTYVKSQWYHYLKPNFTKPFRFIFLTILGGKRQFMAQY